MQNKTFLVSIFYSFLLQRTPSSQKAVSETLDQAESEEDWEDEANQLYEWTQELSFDDLTMTPRMNTAQMV